MPKITMKIYHILTIVLLSFAVCLAIVFFTSQEEKKEDIKEINAIADMQKQIENDVCDSFVKATDDVDKKHCKRMMSKHDKVILDALSDKEEIAEYYATQARNYARTINEHKISWTFPKDSIEEADLLEPAEIGDITRDVEQYVEEHYEMYMK